MLLHTYFSQKSVYPSVFLLLNETAKQRLKLMGKKIFTILRSNILFDLNVCNYLQDEEDDEDFGPEDEDDDEDELGEEEEEAEGIYIAPDQYTQGTKIPLVCSLSRVKSRKVKHFFSEDECFRKNYLRKSYCILLSL